MRLRSAYRTVLLFAFLLKAIIPQGMMLNPHGFSAGESLISICTPNGIRYIRASNLGFPPLSELPELSEFSETSGYSTKPPFDALKSTGGSKEAGPEKEHDGNDHTPCPYAALDHSISPALPFFHILSTANSFQTPSFERTLWQAPTSNHMARGPPHI